MDNTTHGCMLRMEYYFSEDQGMLIGVLGLGMIFGTLTGAAALIAGQSFLMALWLYASVGTLSALMIAIALYVFSGSQPCASDAERQGAR